MPLDRSENETFSGAEPEVVEALKSAIGVSLTVMKADLVSEGDTWPVFTSEVTIHTRDANGGLFMMGVGSTLVDGGKIGFNDYGDGGSWEWRLLFDTRVDGTATDVGLCATHPDSDTWFLTADGAACGGAVDGVTELWRVQGGVFTHVADFDTPMHLTLTKRDP